jgi:Fe(II)/alpha-ketoglutarate-dependent arginine beta-hydroxylase
MNKTVLTETEISHIRLILNSLVSEYASAEAPDFLRLARIYAHELPRRLRQTLTEFGTVETDLGIHLITGYQIDDGKIGLTPEHWKDNPDRSKTLEEEMLLVLFGSLLGELFGWVTQQGGRIIHDVMPIKGNENEQLGTGSEQLLWWHNEDAFHPYRGDYLGMMCLRNPDQVATTIACVDQINLTAEQSALLFETRYVIRPDESHQEKNSCYLVGESPTSEQDVSFAYERIQRMNTLPQKLSVLFGDPECPYIRLDPYFMDRDQLDPEAREALDAIVQSLDTVLQDLVLKPGDFVFIDNYRTVHGRRPFKARYNGYDRWLKRINITKDLRKSRDARLASTERHIY